MTTKFPTGVKKDVFGIIKKHVHINNICLISHLFQQLPECLLLAMLLATLYTVESIIL